MVLSFQAGFQSISMSHLEVRTLQRCLEMAEGAPHRAVFFYQQVVVLVDHLLMAPSAQTCPTTGKTSEPKTTTTTKMITIATLEAGMILVSLLLLLPERCT
jgi:hypothetical protein